MTDATAAVLALESSGSPGEQALRASEAALRARLVSVTHKIMYLLQARDLWLIEHDKLLARMESNAPVSESKPAS